MNKLTAEKCREHIARLRRYEMESLYQFPFEIDMREAFEIALPILEQQERGEGEWVEWGGGERPMHAHVKVEVKHRDSLCASTVSRAHDFDWNHYGYKFGPDIIAYRIIPEQPTNQNGEQ